MKRGSRDLMSPQAGGFVFVSVLPVNVTIDLCGYRLEGLVRTWLSNAL